LLCSHSLHRNLEGLSQQFASLQASFRETESVRHQTELQFQATQTRDRETNALNLHQFKLYLSSVMGIGVTNRIPAGSAENDDEGTSISVAATGEEITHLGDGNSLLERQGALEASVTEDMALIKRAVADLKSRVASTHLLIAASADSASLPAASTAAVGGNNRKVITADVLDTMSRAISKLSVDHEKQLRKVSDIDSSCIKLQQVLNDQSADLVSQVDELKTVISAEISGRRKGQAKIQTVLEGVLNAQNDKEDVISLRREMQTIVEQFTARLDSNERLMHTMTNMLRREIDDSKEFARTAVHSLREEMRSYSQSVQNTVNSGAARETAEYVAPEMGSKGHAKQSLSTATNASDDPEIQHLTDLMLLRQRVDDIEDRLDSIGNSVVGVEDVMNQGFQSVANNMRGQQQAHDSSVLQVQELISSTKTNLENEVEEVVVNIGRALRALQDSQRSHAAVIGSRADVPRDGKGTASETAVSIKAEGVVESSRTLMSLKELHPDGVRAESLNAADVGHVSNLDEGGDCVGENGGAQRNNDDDFDDVISVERIVAINYVCDTINSDDVVKRVSKWLTKLSGESLQPARMPSKPTDVLQSQSPRNMSASKLSKMSDEELAVLVHNQVYGLPTLTALSHEDSFSASTLREGVANAVPSCVSDDVDQTADPNAASATLIQARLRGIAARKQSSSLRPSGSQVVARIPPQDLDLGFVEMRAEPVYHDSETEAATLIQARLRGMAARKSSSLTEEQSNKSSLQEEQSNKSSLQEEEHRRQAAAVQHVQDMAATGIQARMRGMASRKWVEDRKRENIEAAIVIQALARGRRVRRMKVVATRESQEEVYSSLDTENENERMAAIKLQSSTRGRIARKEFKQITKVTNQAAVKIQSRFRGTASRMQILESHLAAESDLEDPRDVDSPAEVEAPISSDVADAAVVKIQSLIRGTAARLETSKKRQAVGAATTIQARTRGMVARAAKTKTND
jgi:hypothetical protein